MKKYVILSLLTLSSLNAQQDDSFAHDNGSETLVRATPKLLHIYSEIIEISSIEYAELMTDPMTNTNQTALRNKLIQQVEAGEAKLFSNQSITTRSRERATIESIKEFIYETEYEPGESIPSTNNTTATNLGFQMVLPPTPTAFEVRNLGTIIEVEPFNTKTPGVIDIIFRPEIAKHIGYNILSEWNTELAKVNVQMPSIYTMRLETSFTAYDNQFTLVATYSPETNGVTDESRKLLHFAKTSILKVGK